MKGDRKIALLCVLLLLCLGIGGDTVNGELQGTEALGPAA
jgi:hypothetical protein